MSAPRPTKIAPAPLTSVVLDLTRFSLALLVAIGHWTQPFFQEGWQDRTTEAVACVGGFFVLSGFTIRMLTPAGATFSARGFFIERLSRLWSVALPALLLTLVFDGASYLINAGFYLSHWQAETVHLPARLFVNVLFASQLWGHDISPLSNSLFWSLSYEAGFYLLYGVFKATRGIWRGALGAATALLVGPNILLMLVPWLAGLFLFDVQARLHLSRPRQTKAALWLASTGVVTSSVLVLWLWRSRRGIIPWLDLLVHEAFLAAGRALPHLPLDLELRPARIDGTLLFGTLLFGLLFGPVMVFCRAYERVGNIPARLVSFARRVGDFTFPLYLFHFPILVLLGAVAFYNRASSPQKIGIFCGVCLVIFFLSPKLAGLKLLLRRKLDAWLPSRAA